MWHMHARTNIQQVSQEEEETPHIDMTLYKGAGRFFGGLH